MEAAATAPEGGEPMEAAATAPGQGEPVSAAATAPDGDERGLRVVLRAGRPTAEEVAAVVAALDTLDGEQPAPRRSAARWSRAGRLEAVGRRPVASPADLPGAAAFG